MKRIDLIKNWTLLPLAGAFIPLNAASMMEKLNAIEAGPLVIGPTIYESIGVDPIINCRGTFTIIGGSVERPEVVAAMKAASGFFVQYDELAFVFDSTINLVQPAKFTVNAWRINKHLNTLDMCRVHVFF